MPLSMKLPYPACYAAARLVRSLRKAHPRPAATQDQKEYYEMQYRSSMRYADGFLAEFPFRGVVLDVGSGLGGRAAHWIERGAERVVNVDINRQELDLGRSLTRQRFPHLEGRIDYLIPEEVEGPHDSAVLVDAFEHLTDPLAVLEQIYDWLRPGGVAWIGSIGWYNYMASHLGLHIPLPWSQVLFSEQALIRTIRSIVREPGYCPNVWEEMEGIDRWDNVRTLRDRPGEPLNMLSLRQCRRVMRDSRFELVRFDVHGFSGRSNPLARFASFLAKVPVARELFHSYYTALLRKPDAAV
jgi:SAM-dependent methyltransferase